MNQSELQHLIFNAVADRPTAENVYQKIAAEFTRMENQIDSLRLQMNASNMDPDAVRVHDQSR